MCLSFVIFRLVVIPFTPAISASPLHAAADPSSQGALHKQPLHTVCLPGSSHPLNQKAGGPFPKLLPNLRAQTNCKVSFQTVPQVMAKASTLNNSSSLSFGAVALFQVYDPHPTLFTYEETKLHTGKLPEVRQYSGSLRLIMVQPPASF